MNWTTGGDAEREAARPWSDRAFSVWGKTDRDGSGALSLVRHLEDAAAVAGALWDHWLPLAVRRLISDGLSGGEADGRCLLTWVAGLHDIGKATPGFALKAAYSPGNEHLVTAMADRGLICPPHVRGGPPLPPHCHLGQYVLSEWIGERYSVGPQAAHALTAPVGMHHGTPPNSLELQGFRGSQWTGHRSDAWRAVQVEIIEGISRQVGASDRLQEWVEHPPRDVVQILLAAAVVVADWLASDTMRFPHDDYRPVRERLEDAALGEALRGPWVPPPPVATAAELLARRFPRVAAHGIRPIQERVRDIAADLAEPGLIVVEAPMGSGKTEAALLAVEELARTFGSGGVFVALPTMATSDAMFTRVREWTRHLEAATGPSMYLAHGKARLNEDYHVLVRESRVRGLNAGEGGPDMEHAVVTSWLQGRRRGVLANMVVGTIDQVLFGALKSRHLALRHLALGGKIVVVDEVHAADAYMRRYLVRMLEWLGAYGTPVILLSATLPRRQLDELTAAYGRGRGTARLGPQQEASYPRITVQTRTLTQVHVPWAAPVNEVDVVSVSTELEDLVDRVTRDVESGGCVVVVRNTVRSAQRTFTALRAALGPDRVSLLHSQFVASDRAAKERAMLLRLGPAGPDVVRPRGHVVVGTQVLEQSLDIDADVMESDHAPVDLLLQRMGRLHRHTRGGVEQSERPASLRRACFRVMGVPKVGLAPELDPGGRAVYGAWGLLTSAAVLAPYIDGRPIRLPHDIARLVEKAYAPGLSAPDGWDLAWDKAEEEASIAESRSSARARTYRVGEPGKNATLVGWLDARAGETLGGEEALGGRARVRDTEDTLEVLLVWRDGDGVVRVLPGDREHAGVDLGVVQMAPPPNAHALSVLACSVRLPHRFAGHWRIDQVIRELESLGSEFLGWQESPWLQGQLVVCLDHELRSTLAGESLRYDTDLGLVVEGREAADGE